VREVSQVTLVQMILRGINASLVRVALEIEWELNQTGEPTEALGFTSRKTCDASVTRSSIM
jgi:hypothetical protein